MHLSPFLLVRAKYYMEIQRVDQPKDLEEAL